MFIFKSPQQHMLHGLLAKYGHFYCSDLNDFYDPWVDKTKLIA